MGAKVYGAIDLTNVEILESDNLNYRFTENCTVKLSKSLKEIDTGSFVINMSNKPRIEYDGLISEFNDLIDHSVSRRVGKTNKLRFIYIMRSLSTKIECNDGTWTSELINSNE